MPRKIPIETGAKFGDWTVLGQSDVQKCNKIYYDCECACGTKKVVNSQHLRRGLTLSCGCRRSTAVSGELSPHWQGVGLVPLKYVGNAKHNAEMRQLEFDVSIEYLSELFEQQGRVCALSGLSIEFGRKNTTASLDRIDSSKGYIEGNVQWLNKFVNQMKWDLTQEQFIDICQRVAEHQKSQGKGLDKPEAVGVE